MDEKINYISENITKISNTSDLINYIEKNLKYSKNANGYFINLSLIDKKHIDFFYISVKNNLKLVDSFSEKVVINNNETKKKDINYKNIELNELQKKMLNYI